ncbi:fumarylacetoacetate hydrolase family protein [Hansschlegelia beijingensis]|uniref:2-keto-4-pentenoate hydratase/2-oxohepta-3-ene-1,7-dioic acid hydratase in catechol pathway n=1 Tax=Hansschlegelia beijingensis TaxID=1133344 RepID=A0A7W6GG96_9HYPH|nr:fumarylacetoacetate hydrolase family protein [Hansschlegelia beijingensis]MBB3972484.1 2-keto-4-pentenoate hydratase/2-oxohepta-3-ene-1,7-dioic acid hydratase in catechol pathway [Hansschlegelia beijingensis]
MKLVRFGEAGAERPGLIDADGAIRDLSDVAPDIAGATLTRAGLDRIRSVDASSLPIVPADARLGPCVGGVRNFIGVGLNFADHAAETGLRIPREPILFNKAPNCIVGPNDDVMLPRGHQRVDWEVELAFVIGDRALYVSEEDALSHVAGLCVCNDVSERYFQTERSGQWTKGKGCPTFGPLGPWLVTLDEIGDLDNLEMFLDINGRRAQTGNTSTMIFKIAYLVSYISQFMALDPGDVVTTGTPPGVGMGMTPPTYLKPGDVMRLGIEGLGEQQQKVVAFREEVGAQPSHAYPSGVDFAR